MPLSGIRSVYPLSTIGRSGEQVMIPVMIDNPAGIRDFSLEMVYPHALLEYIGVLSSPLTHRFEYLAGVEELPGVIRIEGDAAEGIEAHGTGSLCVAVFRVREGAYGDAPVELFNLDADLYEAEAGIGRFRAGHPSDEEGSLTLGRARERGGRMVVPVRVADTSAVTAFGLELRFSPESLRFVGVEPTELTRGFVSLDGAEIEPGMVRVGGFSLGSNQDESRGSLVRLIFEKIGVGGEVEIVDATDDLENFTIIK
jgi:hypothetical protein